MKFSQIEYKRPDFESILSEMDKAVKKASFRKSARDQIDALDIFSRLYDDFSTQYAIVRIRHLLNVDDGFYAAEQKLFVKYYPLINLKYQHLENDIIDSPFKEEIEKVIGSVAMANFKLNSKVISEEVVDDMREESSLVLEYVGIISKLSVDFDGETIPLTMLAKYKESTDREVRRRAIIAEGEVYSSVKGILDDIFDRLVKNRTRQAKKLGFDSFVELGYARMRRNCYKPKDVAIFKKQVIDNIVPLVERIFENRKRRLELDDIYLYDLPLTFKDGAPKPQVSGEEIIEGGRRLYHEMSKKTSEFVDMMIDNELIDVYAKIGKSPGGFCSYLTNYNYPFIFANFNGTSTDVYVFTHEIGHALAKYLNGLKNKMDYSTSTMDISETHSMSMEFLTSPWYELFFKEEADKYRLSHAENALIFIPYACQVDEFQEQIYRSPDLTAKERDEKWLEIERKYRPHIKSLDIPFYGDGAGWQRQTHIYKTPFYYIDYGLAQMMAIQFFSLFLKDKDEAYKLYFNFLDYGNDKSFVDLISELGLASPLVEGALLPIVEDLFGWIEENSIKY